MDTVTVTVNGEDQELSPVSWVGTNGGGHRGLIGPVTHVFASMDEALTQDRRAVKEICNALTAAHHQGHIPAGEVERRWPETGLIH